MNVSKLISIARNAAEVIAAGTAIPAALQLGKEVIEFIDGVKSTVSSTDQAALQAEADALWARVKAHEAETFARLDEAAKE